MKSPFGMAYSQGAMLVSGSVTSLPVDFLFTKLILDRSSTNVQNFCAFGANTVTCPVGPVTTWFPYGSCNPRAPISR